MTGQFDPVAYFRSISPPEGWANELEALTDATAILARLEQIDDAARDGWAQHTLERERWIAHVLSRLSQGQPEYEDRSVQRPVADLLREIAEEAADIGGWAAITQRAIDVAAISEHDRQILAGSIRNAVAAGMQAWARISQAIELLAILERGEG